MDCLLTNNDACVTGGSEDGIIFFWDLVDASVVSSFRAHASVVCVSTKPGSAEVHYRSPDSSTKDIQ